MHIHKLCEIFSITNKLYKSPYIHLGSACKKVQEVEINIFSLIFNKITIVMMNFSINIINLYDKISSYTQIYWFFFNI